MNNHKKCNTCKLEKEFSQYYVCKSHKDGLSNMCKVCSKEYYKQHKEKKLKYAEEYRTKNSKNIANYLKTYAKENRKHLKIYYKAWTSKNRIHLNKYRMKYMENPIVRLDHHIGTHIGRELKGKKKGQQWEKILGYTLEDLSKHLESHFIDGMTWDNYGKWHVDHIIPRSYFNHTGINDPIFKQCWSLSNLQPLWGIDNCIKGNRFVG